jgi:hypothetical protein
METADQASRAFLPARKSLRNFKRTPQYRALLTSVMARRESPSMTATERRRLRLDRVLASHEWDLLQRGEPLSEFSGVIALPDPLRGLLPEGGYE